MLIFEDNEPNRHNILCPSTGVIGIEGFPKIRVELVLSCVCLFNSFLQHLVAKCKSSDPTALAMEGGGTSGQMAKRWCHMWLTAKEGLPKSLKICTYHRAGQTRTSQIFTQVGEHSCRHGRWVTSSRPIFLGSPSCIPSSHKYHGDTFCSVYCGYLQALQERKMAEWSYFQLSQDSSSLVTWMMSL